MRRIQLEDLSKQLGFSKTLISMVLNGKGNHYGISKKTQAIVLDAIAKVNYAPNKFAKSLRTGKSFFIGLIVPDISNPFYSTIAKKIENILFEHNYNLLVCSTEENIEKEKLLVEMMVNQQGVDGLILASCYQDATFYERAVLSHIPVIFIDRVLPNFGGNFVSIDNYSGAKEIVTHLLEKGFKNIACFAITPIYLSTINDRLLGFKNAHKHFSIIMSENLIKVVNFEKIMEDVEKGLTEILESDKNLDAVFALNNHIAIALLTCLRKEKFRKFAQVQIACFDDIATFDIIDKKVLSVSQPIEEIGKQASELLLEILAGKKNAKENIVLPPKLIVR
jgi:LacI family transcriptional regulator